MTTPKKDKGIIAHATKTSLTDLNKKWIPHSWTLYRLKISERNIEIIDNTETTLYFHDIGFIPDITSKYIIEL